MSDIGLKTNAKDEKPQTLSPPVEDILSLCVTIQQKHGPRTKARARGLEEEQPGNASQEMTHKLDTQ